MLALLVIFVILLYFLLSWTRMIKETAILNIPGPLPLPILGNGHLLIGDSSHFLKALSNLAEKYGEVFRVYSSVIHYRMIIISDPIYIEALYKHSEGSNKDLSLRMTRSWLGEGVINSSGQKWRAHRKLLTPAFQGNHLHSYVPLFLKNTHVLIRKLRQVAHGRPIDLFPIIALASLDNITETVMADFMDAQNSTDSKYVKAIDEMLEIISMKVSTPIYMVDAIFNLLPLKKKQDKLVETLHNHTKNVIEKRRQELKSLNITDFNSTNDSGLKYRSLFLDLLLFGEADGKKLNDEEIRNEIDTFLVAGYDTVACCLSFTLYCISNHKVVQNKLVEEQKRIFGNNLQRDPTYNELQEMTYLEMVIKESLRLYPPVALTVRSIYKDISVAGLHIPKDTTILVNKHRVNHHPDIYEEPFEFRPERFENGKFSAYEWISFGAGPRVCLGQKYAMMEMKVVLSSVLRNFELHPSGIELELMPDVILKSETGIQVKVELRKY